MHNALNIISKKINFNHIIAFILLTIIGINMIKESYKDEDIKVGLSIKELIAAASILAKTERDHYMCNLHNECPYYQWNKNMGYPTKQHRLAIEQYGSSPYHRMSFQLLKPKELTLFE